jgi:hypothetical protein
MANRYSVPPEYLVNLNSDLNFELEGKIKFIAITYSLKLKFHCNLKVFPISQNVCIWQAFQALCNVKLKLIGPIHKLRLKLSVMIAHPLLLRQSILEFKTRARFCPVS